jgi:hypothetical protein
MISNISNSNSNQNQFKRVTINPNLSEEESLTYLGDSGSSQNNKSSPRIVSSVIANLPAKIIQDARTRTPSPIRNIQSDVNQSRMQQQNQQQHNQHQQQEKNIRSDTIKQKPSVTEHRRIQIQPTGSGKATKAMFANSGLVTNSVEEEKEGDNSGLRYLEHQRKELQRQQMLELQRFKQKKAEIIKLNNRKKEIELMRSIETEKNKLRKIHSKQVELNEIYKNAVETDTTSNNDTSSIGNSKMTNANASALGGNTVKRLEIYDVDAKRTKKNLAQSNITTNIAANGLGLAKPVTNKIVVVDTVIPKSKEKSNLAEVPKNDNEKNKDVNKDVNKNDKNNENNEDIDTVKVSDANDEINEDSIKNAKNKEKFKAKETDKNTDKESKESKEVKEIKEVKETKKSLINDKVVKKEIKIGDRLEYYSLKEKPDVKWPGKAELYNSENFEDKLVIYLAAAPFFNRKQLKNKTTPDVINRELGELYGFKNLDKFKQELLDVIHKIIVGDKIKFTFE